MMFRGIILSACFLLVGFAQNALSAQSSANPWTQVSELDLNKKNAERRIVPDQYQTFRLDGKKLQKLLLKTPTRFAEEGKTAEVILDLPNPDGSFSSYRVYYAPIMHPELAAKFPEIRSYFGQGIDEPTASVRFDFSPYGFHAMVLSAEHSNVFIDPYAVGDNENYVVYYKKDFTKKDGSTFECDFDKVNPHVDQLPLENPDQKSFGSCILRTYRLALACTGEYATYHGGTVPSVMAAMNTSMTRVNGVYEREMAVTMQLVPNNDQLIFLNANSDPYSNGSGGAMLGQNVTTCNNIIGSSNYDIGHVFSTGGGGVAYLQCVCTSDKAGGVTGQSNPVGDPFDIDYVCHEMGHQFGGRHTQNNNCNRDGQSAYEPGSASTIMGYAGICSPNVQSNSDDYFHINSLILMSNFVNGPGNSCAAGTDTGNDEPTANAGNDYTIPKSTPFMLTGAGSDPNGDALTYCWEQYDNQVATMPPQPTNTNGPAFRSLDPTASPTRTLPNMDAVVSGTMPTWEVLSSVARTYNFRLTVRDNHLGTGCADWDAMVVNVSGSAGPFLVTAPNAPTNWPAGTQQMVSWDVAGTNSAPVNATTVDIFLSTDGGYNYPITLATGTPNDGSHMITVPNVGTNMARVMVKGGNNIFFDISNQNFTITPQVEDFTLQVTPPQQSVCAPLNATYTVDIGSIGGFNGPVSLSVTGLPLGASASFSVNPVNAPGSSVLTISNTGAATPGSYPLNVQGVGTPGMHDQGIGLIISPAPPTLIPLLSPPDNALDVPTQTSFTWQPHPNATSYAIQIATDQAFSNIVAGATGLLVPTYSLPAPLDASTEYYWRVSGSNLCGDGPFGDTWSFTTIGEACDIYASTDVPVDITGDGTPTIKSTLDLPVEGVITDLNVIGLDISHTYISDLTIQLTSPFGTTITLAGPLCDDEDNLLLSFDDEAALGYGDIPCPPTGGGTYQPLEALSAFLGQPASGVWTLTVIDGFDQDGGSLNGWGLQVCTEPVTEELTIEVTGTNESCPGEADGTAEVFPAGGTGFYLISWSNGATTNQITGLAPGAYGVTVDDGNSTASGSVNVGSPPALSLSISGTDATNGNNGAADLTVSGGTPVYTFLWSTDETTEDIDNLAPGMYEVVVTDANGCTASATVEIMDASTGDDCQPFVPTNVTTTGSTATIEWDPIPGAIQYRLRYREAGSAGPWFQEATNSTSITLEGLDPATTYEYETKTRCSDVITPWSSTLYEFTTENMTDPICMPFVPLTIDPSTSTVTISWAAEPGATKYRLQYRPVGSSTWIRVGTDETSITLTGLTPGTEYEFVTSTFCPDGWTDNSEPYNFTTDPLLLLEKPSTPAVWQPAGKPTAPATLEFQLQPNPARDHLVVKVVEGEGKVVYLQDYSGRPLRQQLLTGGTLELDLSELPAGIYFLTMTGEQTGPVTRRFVIAR